MRFQIEYEGSGYYFELDNLGQIWRIEIDPILGETKVGIIHDLVNSLDEAKAIAEEMLYKMGE